MAVLFPRTAAAAVVAGTVCLAGVALPVTGQTVEDPVGTWLNDPNNGCKIWNGYPEPGESATWDGPCEDGFASGEGTVQWYEDGEDNGRYIGERRRGRAHGYGINLWANGDRYEGYWQDDLQHGQGTYTWSDGSGYQGEWFEGKKHGRATFIWPNGSRFEGTYRDNKPFGGVFIKPDGTRYIAQVYDQTVHPGPRLFTPEERTHVRTIGSKICHPGSMFFGIIDTTIVGFVENVQEDRVQIRIARTGLPFQSYQEITLGQNTVIWDDADNWEPCRPAETLF